MASSSRRDVPIESSWRLVDGDHDSFDTSLVPDDDEPFLSSGPSQLSSAGHSHGQPSFGASFGNSQDDSLQSFLTRADDERVILRSPFQPSVPSTSRHTSTASRNVISPDPEFVMPSVEIEGSRRRITRNPARPIERSLLRQRPFADVRPNPRSRFAPDKSRHDNGHGEPPLGNRLARSLPTALFDMAAWTLGIIGLALRYARKPLAIMLAVYLVFGTLIVTQNMVTKSLAVSMSPLCRLPGASWLNLPFCPSTPMDGPGRRDKTGKPVEFAGLMDVQDSFEEVLEKSAHGVSLPMEMKRSEAAIRDLRTMVHYSNLPSKEELVLQFDDFIDTAKVASSDLQRFNVHVGSAVDSVISINRWTSRFIEGLTQERETQGLIQDVFAWAMAPFQPVVISERVLLDKYIEHTALVSEKIAVLIVEAQAVLRMLSKAEVQLGHIHDTITRTQESVQSRKDDILWTLWTLVGANYRNINKLNGQLALLRTASGQRVTAVRQVSELMVELEKIQAGLSDLRDRLAEPGIAADSGMAEIPLSVHVETINMGVERLEHARNRIRAVENDRIAEVLARGQKAEIGTG